VNGTNDLATVTSEIKPVSEGDTAGALNTSGKLTVGDLDAGQNHVVAQTVDGAYGTIAVAEDGTWTFTSNGAHNELTQGQAVSQSLVVSSADGSAKGTITVNITGTQDVASVSSESKPVTEGDTAGALNTSGKLTVGDLDAGQNHVVAQTVEGTYGTIAVAEDGTWTFTSNGAHNELTQGQAVSQSLDVSSADGSAAGTITVNITGSNDAPVLSVSTQSTVVQQG